MEVKKIEINDKDFKTLKKKIPKLKQRYERKVPRKLLKDPRFTYWIGTSEKNENKAMCKICNCEISGGITQIERHGKTVKHLKNIKLRKQTSEVLDYFMQEITTTDKEKSDNGLTTVLYEQPKIESLVKDPENNRDEIETKSKMRTFTMMDHDTFLQKAAQVLSQEDDQYLVFGKYVASEMRNMNSEYLRKKMKRKIQQVIAEINQEEEENLKQEAFSSLATMSNQSGQSNTSGPLIPGEYIKRAHSPSYVETN